MEGSDAHVSIYKADVPFHLQGEYHDSPWQRAFRLITHQTSVALLFRVYSGYYTIQSANKIW